MASELAIKAGNSSQPLHKGSTPTILTFTIFATIHSPKKEVSCAGTTFSLSRVSVNLLKQFCVLLLLLPKLFNVLLDRVDTFH